MVNEASIHMPGANLITWEGNDAFVCFWGIKRLTLSVCFRLGFYDALRILGLLGWMGSWMVDHLTYFLRCIMALGTANEPSR